MELKAAKNMYLKKGYVGYDFDRGYKYDAKDRKCRAIANTFKVTETKNQGFTWVEKVIKFETAEEGNEFFMNLRKDGFEICTRKEYDKLRPFD